MEVTFQELAKLQREGKDAALAIIVQTQGATPRKTGTKMVVTEDGKTTGTMGGGDLEKRVVQESLEAMEKGEPRLISFTLDRTVNGNLDMMCGGRVDAYIEPLGRSPRLVIFGAGHISRSLAPMMQLAAFRVTVVDDSEELVREDPLPGLEGLVVEDLCTFAEKLDGGPDLYVVIMSQGFSSDQAILERCLAKASTYIGMIGSRNKWQSMKKNLVKKGVDGESLARVKTPIGLDIGAETPHEIAITIAAELIAVRKGKKNLESSKLD